LDITLDDGPSKIQKKDRPPTPPKLSPERLRSAPASRSVSRRSSPQKVDGKVFDLEDMQVDSSKNDVFDFGIAEGEGATENIESRLEEQREFTNEFGTIATHVETLEDDAPSAPDFIIDDKTTDVDLTSGVAASSSNQKPRRRNQGQDIEVIATSKPKVDLASNDTIMLTDVPNKKKKNKKKASNVELVKEEKQISEAKEEEKTAEELVLVEEEPLVIDEEEESDKPLDIPVPTDTWTEVNISRKKKNHNNHVTFSQTGALSSLGSKASTV
jgi:hypothetical protein